MADSIPPQRRSVPGTATGSGPIEKYLVFRVGAEEHGVELLSVREVSSQRPVRPIPGAPTHVAGVMNLRGHVISVVSVAGLLGESVDYGDGVAAMLIVDLPVTTLAVLVDEVIAVRSIAEGEIDRGHHPELPIASRYVAGIAHVDQRLVTLLNLPALLETEILGKAV